MILLSCLFASATTFDGSGLRELAERRHFNLGSAMPVRCLRDEVDGGRYTSTATANFNLLEMENELKPPAVWTGPREYRFTDPDFVLGEPGKEGWAQRHGFKVRGHVLVYARDDGYTLPQWIRASGEALGKDQAAELLHDYIRAVAGRYQGKIAMWDVANEAIDDHPNGNPFNLRNSYWFRKLGPEFLVLAFKWAREADPKAELYYNDYAVEKGGEKADHMLELAKWLKAQGAPIDGLGLQYHIGIRTVVKPGDDHYRLIQAIEKLGLSTMITELDVTVPTKPRPAGDPDRGVIPDDPGDLERQAKSYESVFRMALSSPNCHGVNVWGLADRYSWIPGITEGRKGAATLFDGEFHPKPAAEAVAAVLRGPS